MTSQVERHIHLPLTQSNECAQCGSTAGLRLCSKCGEVMYCSTECQSRDWTSAHRLQCGKTERVDISSFYPFLAALAQTARASESGYPHPALRKEILNDPNPDTYATLMPDGTSAKVVMLGDSIPDHEMSSSKWWPSADTPSVRRKLFRRFTNEFNLMPIVVSLMVSLVEMYTTTSAAKSESTGQKQQTRVRLKYKSSPISDFGIIQGAADVKNQDRFMYWDAINNIVTRGQDPEDHYWMYFTTSRGEDIFLDVGMYCFNFCTLVNAIPYCLPGMPPSPSTYLMEDYVPAHFEERELLSKCAVSLRKERQRISVLRDEDAHIAIQNITLPEENSIRMNRSGQNAIIRFMERLTGRACSNFERRLSFEYILRNVAFMRVLLMAQRWRTWPELPSCGIETDPGESFDDHKNDEKFWKEYARYGKKLKKGKITREQFNEAWRNLKAVNKFPE